MYRSLIIRLVCDLIVTGVFAFVSVESALTMREDLALISAVLIVCTLIWGHDVLVDIRRLFELRRSLNDNK